LLGQVKSLLEKNKYVIVNVDSTIVLEEPKVAGHIPAMRKNISGALGVVITSVSVKATTAEGLGFTGKGEGASAYAIASIGQAGSGT
jgi:2-C-methyl-D-erythritol 2,4-cyclodiphosphate synthase